MLFSDVIKKAAQIISEGGVILYPTDTIWGIGGDASDASVIEKIYNIKKRPDSKSLVSLVSGLEMLESMTMVSDKVKILLDQANQPTTIIYDNVSGINSLALAADGSAAIRIPNFEFCTQLILKMNKPLISTSANLSGESSPKGFSDISEEIKAAVDYIVPLSLENKSGQTASRILKLAGEEVIVLRE